MQITRERERGREGGSEGAAALEEDIHSRQFSIGIVGRGNFYNIGADEVQSVQATNDRSKFTRRPAAGLRSSSCRGDCEDQE